MHCRYQKDIRATRGNHSKQNWEDILCTQSGALTFRRIFEPMHFSKLPSNPSLTKLVSFVPLKNHTPWFALGLGKGGLCVTETLFNKKL